MRGKTLIAEKLSQSKPYGIYGKGGVAIMNIHWSLSQIG